MTPPRPCGARLTSGGGREDTKMRMDELQKAYGLAVKASENPNTPLRERNQYRAIAHLIWKSCGDTRNEQTGLVEAADKIAGR
jgi:hypothetical protein